LRKYQVVLWLIKKNISDDSAKGILAAKGLKMKKYKKKKHIRKILVLISLKAEKMIAFENAQLLLADLSKSH